MTLYERLEEKAKEIGFSSITKFFDAAEVNTNARVALKKTGRLSDTYKMRIARVLKCSVGDINRMMSEAQADALKKDWPDKAKCSPCKPAAEPEPAPASEPAPEPEPEDDSDDTYQYVTGASQGFIWPCPTVLNMTDTYGYRTIAEEGGASDFHKGIDIKVYIGDTIRAAFPGKVRMVKYEAAGYGKYVVIRHQNGLETIYGHMSNWLVKEDEVVKAGQPIGLGGNTGRSTGSHLHFETRLCGVALNPALMFDFRNQDVVDDYYMFRKDRYESESIAANQLRGKVGNGSYTAAEVRGEKTQANNAKKERIENKNSEIRYHKVAAGETLYSIAKRRKVTVDDLCRLNHLTRDIKVRPGQLLRYS